MKDVFTRISGFIKKNDGSYEDNFCSFRLKRYQHNNNRRTENLVLDEIQYEMSHHIGPEERKVSNDKSKKDLPLKVEEYVPEIDQDRLQEMRSIVFKPFDAKIGNVRLDFKLKIKRTDNCNNKKQFN